MVTVDSADFWYKIMFLGNILLTISIVWFVYEIHITRSIFYGALEVYAKVTPGVTFNGHSLIIDPDSPDNFMVEPWVGDFNKPVS